MKTHFKLFNNTQTNTHVFRGKEELIHADLALISSNVKNYSVAEGRS